MTTATTTAITTATTTITTATTTTATCHGGSDDSCCNLHQAAPPCSCWAQRLGAVGCWAYRWDVQLYRDLAELGDPYLGAGYWWLRVFWPVGA